MIDNHYDLICDQRLLAFHYFAGSISKRLWALTPGDQRLLAFHYFAAFSCLHANTKLRRDQRLLAFHYFAGQLLKRLPRKAPYSILQVSLPIEPLTGKNSLNL